MPKGPGKYDDLCEDVLKKSNAECVIVMVINGSLGNGFSVSSTRTDILFDLPYMLEQMASEIRNSLPQTNLN